MKRILLSLLAVVVVLAGVLLTKAARFTSRQAQPETAAPFTVDADAAAARLGGALRLKTLAASEGKPAEDAAFAALHAYIQEQYPRIHQTLKREPVGAHSVLYTWAGSDASLRPAMLMGHLDVVPVEPGTEATWTHPPYSGLVAEGYVWGRGALDDKGSVFGILESVEALLAAGFQPRRTVLLAFGGDEEVGGHEGAETLARQLREQGVTLESVLDEGGMIVSGTVPGVASPVALVGVAEKGFASAELIVNGEGGHSSMPPPQTAVGVLSRAISRLEDSPMPAHLRGGSRALFEFAGPEMGFGMRVLFANLWLFEPLVLRQLTGKATTNAAVRTTTAATMFEGSERDNVLPARARAVVNFRILPGDSVESVLEHVRDAVDDPRVKVSTLGFVSEPSPVSRTDSEAWTQLLRSVRQVFPDVVVAPYLMLGASDSRYFTGLSENVYRFMPLRLDSADLSRLHGKDERVSVQGYADAVRFYAQYVRNVAH
ncbi:macromolecule metabolism [Myxococcus hansupus]|uniref:Macromolecule metabolism n=1 Tax=Pseudomyxococcus hansupus TaxID=1297742 RepID=A0A0H4X1W1_9BACT|nr:M20 family peptidase [Myxococcus hansupus]AKQ67848.1 macromolecule metabolism [Myxococcus hansupus]